MEKPLYILNKTFWNFLQLINKLPLYFRKMVWYSVFGCDTKVCERWTEMSEKPNFLLVSAQVLPEVFLKVVEAKMLLAQGKAKSSSQAAKLAGISRSAFYKYKDSVYLYDERMSESLVTFSLTLEDRPGVLSSTLTELYKAGANIITVNQNIPVDGVAIVSISARIGNASCSRLEILEMLGNLDGIVEAKTI